MPETSSPPSTSSRHPRRREPRFPSTSAGSASRTASPSPPAKRICCDRCRPPNDARAPASPRMRGFSSHVLLGLCARNVRVEIRQALDFGDLHIARVDAVPLLGDLPLAFPALRIGHRVLDLHFLSPFPQPHAFDDV